MRPADLIVALGLKGLPADVNVRTTATAVTGKLIATVHGRPGPDGITWLDGLVVEAGDALTVVPWHAVTSITATRTPHPALGGPA